MQHDVGALLTFTGCSLSWTLFCREAKYAQLQQELDATKQEVQKREAALSSANADIEKLRASGLAHEETISVMKGKIMVLEQTASRSKAVLLPFPHLAPCLLLLSSCLTHSYLAQTAVSAVHGLQYCPR